MTRENRRNSLVLHEGDIESVSPSDSRSRPLTPFSPLARACQSELVKRLPGRDYPRQTRVVVDGFTRHSTSAGRVRDGPDHRLEAPARGTSVFTDSVAAITREGRHHILHCLQAVADLQRETPVAEPEPGVRLEKFARPLLSALQHPCAPFWRGSLVVSVWLTERWTQDAVETFRHPACRARFCKTFWAPGRHEPQWCKDYRQVRFHEEDGPPGAAWPRGVARQNRRLPTAEPMKADCAARRSAGWFAKPPPMKQRPAPSAVRLWEAPGDGSADRQRGPPDPLLRC